MSKRLKLAKGQVFTRDDGSYVEVHLIKESTVYFASWGVRQHRGIRFQMDIHEFGSLLKGEGLKLMVAGEDHAET
tara:strand:+ start:257 stop:481 length:225 start_codon:yes stop_codon:yes gene_type:complete